jgi:pyruvate/2-oxoglutarate dehydrogenase complex dihydrolipoamide dehydrogenase (E3) component
VGGGIIGLEMACVYEALGSKVTVVELLDQLMPGTDPDLVRPLQQRIQKRYAGIHVKTKVAKVVVTSEGLKATFEAAGGARRRRRRCSTACWSRSGARRTASASTRRPRACR